MRESYGWRCLAKALRDTEAFVGARGSLVVIGVGFVLAYTSSPSSTVINSAIAGAIGAAVAVIVAAVLVFLGFLTLAPGRLAAEDAQEREELVAERDAALGVLEDKEARLRLKQLIFELDQRAIRMLADAGTTDEAIQVFRQEIVDRLVPAIGISEAMHILSNAGFWAGSYISKDGLSGERGQDVSRRRERLADLMKRADAITLEAAFVSQSR